MMDTRDKDRVAQDGASDGKDGLAESGKGGTAGRPVGRITVRKIAVKKGGGHTPAGGVSHDMPANSHNSTAGGMTDGGTPAGVMGSRDPGAETPAENPTETPEGGVPDMTPAGVDTENGSLQKEGGVGAFWKNFFAGIPEAAERLFGAAQKDAGQKNGAAETGADASERERDIYKAYEETTKFAGAPEEMPRESPINDDSSLSYDIGTDKTALYKSYRRKRKPADDNVERFNPSLTYGLSKDQVRVRFGQYLFNDVRHNQSKSYLSIFVSNICTFFNLLCLLAALALILAGVTKISSYLVLLITLANICIGIIWEIRSKRAIDRLNIMSVRTSRVIRDGKPVDIPSKEIVMDDVLLLEIGGQVPADCVLAEGSVEVNEALLTGESESVKKKPGDTLFSGSYISSGTGKFRVQKVGENTYLQKLTSKAKKYKKPNSEIMSSTKLIIKIIAILIIPIAIGIFYTSWISYDPSNPANEFIFSGQASYALQRAATVVIGMIPSGMLLLTSLALSLGVIRLARSNTMVQDLYSLEMLARVNVLCLDKTGTITDGKMQVRDCVVLNPPEKYSVDEVIGSMLKTLGDNNQTFIALYNRFGFSDALTPRERIHFSSQRKLSAVTFEGAGTFCLGAPEYVLRPYPSRVEKLVRRYSEKGLRVVVLAHSPSPIAGDRLPPVMKPVAVIAIADNIREDAIETLKWFRENDVKIKVISGDNPVTVSEVAKRAGVPDADRFVSLEGLNDAEVASVANEYSVFGRVTPEQKAILIKSIRAGGNTVAMTGDGVNDILAMKEADCAIGLASGSEAATNVSHLVLMDSNFASMPKIVAEGRRVINNVKGTSSMYLMKTFFTTLLAAICIFMGKQYIFTTDNLLLEEIFVSGLATFFISLQPNNERVHGKFLSYVVSRALSGAAVMIICVMATYLICSDSPGFGLSPESCTAMCMLALTTSGFVMLYRICQPMNLYRGVMYVCLVGVSVVCVAVPVTAEMLCTGFSDIQWTYELIVTLIVVGEAAVALSAVSQRIADFFVPARERPPRQPKGPLQRDRKDGGQKDDAR